MAASKKAWPLSIYLVKKDKRKDSEILKDFGSLKSLPLGGADNSIGMLYYKTTGLRPPAWAKFFGSLINPKLLATSSVAAILLIRVGGRIFALTFGLGRFFLDPSAYEEQFGLRVTLNSVNPDRIRTLDRKTLDATGRHTREQANRNIRIVEFGLDIDKDILTAVTGPPEDSSLGQRLTGADALSALVSVTPNKLGPLLQSYLRQFRKKLFKERFPWVDNIREVGPAVKREELDEILLSRINSNDLDRIWLAVPDLMEWNDVAGFRYGRSESAMLRDDISFATYLGYADNGHDLVVESLHRQRVYCISAQTDLPKAEWPVYRCIYAEIDREEGTFLLNNAKWYQINTNYLNAVNNDIEKIRPSKTITFLPFQDDSEENYNERLEQSDTKNFALMDQKMVRYGGGHSQIEFCDLFTRKKEMVHVKRYGGSSVLSHLFSQGLVSASLLLMDQHFRVALNDILPQSHKLASPKNRPSPAEFQVSYAIASKAKQDRLVLPFFSRVTLRSTYQQLTNLGFNVTLTKIQCN